MTLSPRNRTRLRYVALTALAAAFTSTAAVPLEFTVLGFLGVAVLLWLLSEPHGGRPIRHGFLIGMVYSTVINAISLYWVVELLEVFAGFPTIASVPVGLLLFSAQGLAYGFAGAITVGLMERGLPGWLVLPAALTLFTSVTPNLFPWRIGYSQIGWLPFVQMAEIGGESLLDFVVTLAGGALYEVVRRLHRANWNLKSRPNLRFPMVTLVLCLLVPWGYGTVRIDQVSALRLEGSDFRVGVVQPNVGIWEKRDRSLAPRHLRELQEMTRDLEAQDVDLTIWPESAYPYALARDFEGELPEHMRPHGSGSSGPLLLGAVTYEGDSRYNSVLSIDENGHRVGLSDKVELLAFGEYVPLWDYLPPLQSRFRRGFTAGDRPRALPVAGAKAGVLNCYEDVIAHYGRSVMRDGPHFLVNTTNDAWFGDTTEPYLHQMVARLRSIETRRDLVRAVNTGVSSHTLATGENAFLSPTFERFTAVARVRLLTGSTPWVKVGDWVTPASLGGLLGCMFGLWRRRRQIP